ncbi:MAG: hypothetical protein EZS28_014997 [Streblomastix strix]|uniref:Uncharacterized protein n=1 Tax=Streblomastix strix TaxID=222440 RepID=A0A5J4W4F9_9EUKA|nr:MAG: hypothetical protein EZS28_014997 [Streblomastix strix]
MRDKVQFLNLYLYLFPSFFLSLIVSMFGISITPLLIFGETPGWLKDSKYTMTFSIIWIFLYILSFQPKLASKLLNFDYLRIIIQFGANISQSHSIINNCIKASERYSKNELFVDMLIGYLVGSSSSFIFFRGSKHFTFSSNLSVIIFIIASHPSAILQPIFSLPFFYDTDSFVYRNEYLQSILLQLKEVAFETENKIYMKSGAKRGFFSNKECKKYILLITGSIAMYLTLFKTLI